VNSFRNGSIVGNFILGFTRYQNVTRLDGFLNRALIGKQLFGGTILAIVFSSTTSNNTNTTYVDVFYEDDGSKSLIIDEDQISSLTADQSNNHLSLETNTQSNSVTIQRIQRHVLRDYSVNRSLYKNNSSISSTAVLSRLSSFDTRSETRRNSSSIKTKSTGHLIVSDNRRETHDRWRKFFNNKTTLSGQK
jgi:hypothetical protein